MTKAILLIGLSALFMAVAHADDAPAGNNVISSIEKYADKTVETLELVKKIVKAEEPIPLSDITMSRVPGLMTKLASYFTNVSVSGLSDFTVTNKASDAAQKLVQLSINVPALTFKGNYLINGTTSGLDVYVKDECTLVVSNTSINANLVFTKNNGVASIENIGITYKIGSIDFHANGDDVEGLSKEQVENLMSYVFMNKSRIHGAYIAKTVGAALQKVANAYLNGQDLKAAIQWARSFAKNQIFH